MGSTEVAAGVSVSGRILDGSEGNWMACIIVELNSIECLYIYTLDVYLAMYMQNLTLFSHLFRPKSMMRYTLVEYLAIHSIHSPQHSQSETATDNNNPSFLNLTHSQASFKLSNKPG